MVPVQVTPASIWATKGCLECKSFARAGSCSGHVKIDWKTHKVGVRNATPTIVSGNIHRDLHGVEVLCALCANLTCYWTCTVGIELAVCHRDGTADRDLGKSITCDLLCRRE